MYLQKTYEFPVEFESCSSLVIDATHAASLAIVVNELVTNGIKHGVGKVTVTCKEAQDILILTVTNSGPKLPKGFSFNASKGFGLKAVKTIVEGLGGKVKAESGGQDGAVFEVTIPTKVLKKRVQV